MGTRSQTLQTPAGLSGPKTAGRLTQTISAFTSQSCPITVSDETVNAAGTGQCDDGSDKNIASPTLEHAAVLKGIGRITAMKPVRLQVPPQGTSEPTTFTFYRKWLMTRLVLRLSSGQTALLNVTFLIADDKTACKDLLVVLPVVRHWGIDSRTLLEKQ